MRKFLFLLILFLGTSCYGQGGGVLTATEVDYFNNDTGYTNLVRYHASRNTVGTKDFYLPAVDGLNGYVMTTNGSGVLSFTPPGLTNVELSTPAQYLTTYGSSGPGEETITLLWDTVPKGYVLAGPTSGAGAAPTFKPR